MRSIPEKDRQINVEALQTESETFPQLLGHLWRGAKFAYYHFEHPTKTRWNKKLKKYVPVKRSMWFPADQIPKVPSRFRSWNCFFGVHGTNAAGNEYQRSKLSLAEDRHVSLVNGVYGEFDGDGAMDRILSLALLPSYMVESSPKKYHCYWIFDESLYIDSPEAQRRAKHIQAAWVELIGSDPAAKDLTRHLRIVGTKNWKAKYAPDYPTVTEVSARIGNVYTIEQIEALIPPLPEPQPKRIYDTPADASDVETALSHLSENNNYDELLRVCMALHNEFGPDHGLALAEKHLTSWQRTNGETLAQKFASFGVGGSVGVGTLFFIAKEHGYIPRQADGYTPCKEFETREQFTEYLKCARLDVRQEFFGDHVPAEYHAKHRDENGEVYKTVYRTTNTDKKIARAILDIADKRGNRQFTLSSLELKKATGLGSDSTARKALERLSGWFIERVNDDSDDNNAFRRAHVYRLIWTAKSKSLTQSDDVSRSLTSSSIKERNNVSDLETDSDIFGQFLRWHVFITGKSKAAKRLGNEIKPLSTTALLIIDSLTDSDGQTRAELSESCGTSKGSVSAMVRRMRDEYGIVCEDNRTIYLEPDWFEVLATFAPKMTSYNIVLERDVKTSNRQIINLHKYHSGDLSAERRIERLREELRLTWLQLDPDISDDHLWIACHPELTATDNERHFAELERQKRHDAAKLERMEDAITLNRELERLSDDERAATIQAISDEGERLAGLRTAPQQAVLI